MVDIKLILVYNKSVRKVWVYRIDRGDKYVYMDYPFGIKENELMYFKTNRIHHFNEGKLNGWKI